jgi:hypothetical protein
MARKSCSIIYKLDAAVKCMVQKSQSFMYDFSSTGHAYDEITFITHQSPRDSCSSQYRKAYTCCQVEEGNSSFLCQSLDLLFSLVDSLSKNLPANLVFMTPGFL